MCDITVDHSFGIKTIFFYSQTTIYCFSSLLTACQKIKVINFKTHFSTKVINFKTHFSTKTRICLRFNENQLEPPPGLT